MKSNIWVICIVIKNTILLKIMETDNNCETHYCYLLQEREFIKTNEPIYKIGRTKQKNNTRLKQYPKNSVLFIQMKCDDCIKTERVLINRFKQKFTLCKDIGNEYFSGNVKDMMKQFINVLSIELDENNEEPEENIIEETEEDIIEETEEYEINTYERYIKFSAISKIVIINKDTKEGYLRFDNAPYRKLYNKNSPDFDINTMETMDSFIEHDTKENNTAYKYYDELLLLNDFCNKNITYQNSNTLLYITKLEYDNLEFIDRLNYTRIYELKIIKSVNLVYNIEALTNDIIKKCYIKKPKYYNLKYDEYIICLSNESRSGHFEYKLFNSKYKIFDNLNDYDNVGIYESNCDGRMICSTKNINHIDVNIVDKIFNYLIVDNSIINEYQKMCYSVFVKQSNKPIIFYDYYYSKNSKNSKNAVLTNWLCNLMNDVSQKPLYISSDLYYDNNTYYNQLFFQTNKIRLVVIEKNENRSCKKMCNDFINLGIKNIIIKNNNMNKNYYTNDFMSYMKENKDEIIKHTRYNDGNELKFKYPTDIISSQQYLMLNYLMWCCSL